MSYKLDPAKKDFYIAESEKYITDCQQKIEEIVLGEQKENTFFF